MEKKNIDIEEIKKKWAILTDEVSENEKSWLADYAKAHDISESTSLLPISIKIAATTVGLDLVPVQPMSSPLGIPSDKLERVINRIKQENRTAKIDSVIDEREFIEKELENDKEYNELLEKYGSPAATLMYLDFKYGSDNV